MFRAAAIPTLILAVVAFWSAATAQSQPATASEALTIDPLLVVRTPSAGRAWAFPAFTENYRTRIVAGDYEIWSEEKLQRWSSAQGLSVTPMTKGLACSTGARQSLVPRESLSPAAAGYRKRQRICQWLGSESRSGGDSGAIG